MMSLNHLHYGEAAGILLPYAFGFKPSEFLPFHTPSTAWRPPGEADPSESDASAEPALACGCPGCAVANSGSVPPPSQTPFTEVTDFTALLSPAFRGDFSRWNYNYDDPAIGVTFVTYSFVEAADLPDPSTVNYSPDEVFSYTQDQREATRLALAAFSETSGLVFLEVEDGGMMSFLGITGSGFGGFAFYPTSNRSSQSGVFIEGTTQTDFSEETSAFQVLLHEIGHAVGLKHPFEGDIRLTDAADNTSNTVMSYNWDGTPKTALSPLDLDAINYLYGADIGNANLNFSIDADTQQFVVVGSEFDDVVSGINLSNSFDGGAGNDTFLGGPLADILNGGAGDDKLIGTGGADVITAGDGKDFAEIEGRDGESRCSKSYYHLELTRQ